MDLSEALPIDALFISQQIAWIMNHPRRALDAPVLVAFAT
jgi:hypothetical protein